MGLGYAWVPKHCLACDPYRCDPSIMNTPSPDRHIAIPGTCNVRDLGGYPADQGQTQWRRLLRADSLSEMDEAGKRQLLNAGLATVIDLRQASEAARAPDPFTSQDPVVQHRIPVFEGIIPKSWPAGAADTDMLFVLYTKALEACGAAFAQVLTTISRADPGLVLFHCSAGKDRTGLVAGLLLALAGVEKQVIVQDYALTESLMASRMSQMVAACYGEGMNAAVIEPLLACKPQTMSDTLDYLKARHGSVEGYLQHIGVESRDIQALQGRLLD